MARRFAAFGRRRWRVWTSGALVLAGATALVAVRLPADAALAPGVGLDQAAITQLAGVMDAAPDEFSGAYLDPATGAVTVRYPQALGEPTAARSQVTRLAAASKAAARAGQVRAAADATDKPVRYVPAKYSLRDLQKVRDQVAADRSWLPAADRILSYYAVDPATNTVTVGVTEVTPAAVTAAEQKFGDRVRVVAGQRQERFDRFVDESPFSAGSVAVDERGARLEQCSTGFAVSRTAGGAGTGLLTAGHCAPNGEQIFNGAGDDMGIGTDSELVNNGHDRAVIEAPSQPSFFVGPGIDQDESSNTRESIIGGGGLLQGMQVCTDGVRSGQVCNGVVIVVSGCFVFPDLTTCSLAMLAPIDGVTRLAVPGDSGGPVVVFDDDGSDTGPAFAVGMIVGGDPGNPLGGLNVTVHSLQNAIPPGWALQTA